MSSIVSRESLRWGRSRLRRVIAGCAIVAAALGQGLPPQALPAATITWNGSTDNSWNTAGNWSTTTIPAAADNVILTTSGTLISTLGAAQSANSLTISAGDTGSLTLGTLNDYALTLGGGGISSGSSFADTINSSIVLGAAQTWTNSGSGLFTVAGNISNGASTLSVAGNGNTTLSGVLGGGSGGLTMSGTGTLTLNGSAANTYTGATTVNSGTLALNFANLATPTNLISSSSPLALNGGTLSVVGNAAGTTSQTFAGTSIGAGSTEVAVFSNGGTGTTLALGAISRSTGGTVDFTLPAAGSIATTAANKAGGTLGGYATVGGTTWATVSGGSIAGLTTYTNDTWASDANITVTASTTQANNSSAWSLRFNNAGASTVTLAGNANVVQSGGILVTSNVGAFNQTITGGTIKGATSANGGDLVVIQNDTAGSLTIASVIADNSAGSGLTKSGAGTLILTGTNTYTGSTYLNGGTVQVSSDAALGAAPSTFTANQLNFNGGTLENNSSYVMLSANRGLNLGVNGGALQADSNKNMFVSGAITGSGGLTINSPSTSGGIVYLLANNTYTGGTTINGGSGILSVGNGFTAGTLPGNVNDNGSLIFNSPVSGTYSGIISGTGTLTQAGNGNLTLNTTHTYTGATTVSAGTLTLQDTNGALAGTSGVTVQGGGTLTLDNAMLGNSSSRLPATAGVTLAGGNLNFLGNAAGSTQTVGTLTVSNGASNVTVTPNGAAAAGLTFGSPTLASIARNTGGTVNFSTGTGTVSMPDVTLVNGIIGGYATVGNDWATVSSGNVSALPAASYTTGNTPGSWAAANNVEIAAPLSAALAANKSINSLNFTTNNTLTVNSTDTLTVTTGGILSSGGGTITGGTIKGASTANGGDLVVIQNSTSNPLTIASVIANNSAGMALTKSGPGTLVLTGTNIYTGKNYFNSGIVNINAAAALGTDVAAGAYTFNGGTLQAGASGIALTALTAINGGGAIYDSNGYSFTASGVNSGVGSLTKVGLGTLTLAGAGAYTGGTFVDGGTLQVGKANALTTTTDLVVNSAGALDLNGNGQQVATLNGSGLVTNSSATAATLTVGNANSVDSGGTFAGTLASDLALTKSGTGVLTLSGTNTNSGVTTISGGTLRVSSAANLGSGGVSLGAATLDLRSDTSTNFAANVTVTGAGFINVDQAVGGVGVNQTHTLGNVTIAGQTLTITGGDGFGLNLGTISNTGAPTITNNAPGTLTMAGISGANTAAETFIINGSSNSVVTGTIADGTAPLTLQHGNGATLTLSGTNTYTGGTNLNGGTVIVSSDANLGNAAGALNFIGISTLQTNAALASARSVVLTAAGTFNSNGYNSTLSGVISGTAGLTKTGAGILALTGSNTYAGTTTVSGGTLQVNNAGNLGASAAVSLGGGTLDLRNDTGTNFAANVTLTANSTINVDQFVGGVGVNQTHTLGSLNMGAQTLTVTGGDGYGLALGAATATAGATIVNNTPGGLSLASLTGSSTAATTVTLGGTGNTSIPGVIGQGTGAVSLLVNGTGTLTLAGTNTYTGTTTIDSGIVNINTNSALGTTGALIFGGGTLQAGANAIALSRTVTLDAGGGTFDTNGYTLTSSGVISGAGSLTKIGAGTLLLSKANTYTGGTFINNGTLQVGIANALTTTGALTVNSGGTLDLNAFAQTVDSLNGAGTITNNATGTAIKALTVGGNNGSGTFSGLISNGATAKVSLTKSGTGTETLTGANTYTGGTTINAGILNINSDSALGASGAIVFNGGTLQAAAAITTARAMTLGAGGGTIDTNGYALTSSGIIISTGGLTKVGAGTLLLSGAETYSGGTTVSAGTLQIGNNNRLLTTGALTVNSGGTFDLNGYNQTVDAFNGSGAVTNNSAGTTLSTLTIGSNNSGGSFSGVISDGATAATALAKSGSGTLALSGANSYSGGTTISGGTLLANNTSGSATGAGAVVVASGGTLGGSGIINGPLTIQNGGTLSPGNVAGGTPGILTVTNSVVLGPTSSFTVEINGLVAGTGYSQLAVAGNSNVALGGNLVTQFSGAWSAAEGDILYVVDNTGSGTTTGQFSNLAENAIVGMYGGSEWQIDYDVDAATNNLSYGSGNDVALSTVTVAAVPEPSTLALLASAGFTITVGVGCRYWRRKARRRRQGGEGAPADAFSRGRQRRRSHAV